MSADRIDWFRVLADLQKRAGLSCAHVARELDMHESTVRAWYSGYSRPNYDNGSAVLGLWSKTLGRPVSKAPTTSDRSTSAARAH